MINLIIYKTLFFFATYNVQSIDFNKDGNLVYAINKQKDGKQSFDLFLYESENHSENRKIFLDIKGHGDKYRARGAKIIFKNSKFYFKNNFGTIIFDNWWGKGYGKAIINGVEHKIDFDILNNKLKTKGTFQGVALSNDYAVFTLSFFDKKTKKLLSNKLYIYDIKSKKTNSYDLKDLNLGKYSIRNKKYKYYEFEGLTFYKNSFYLGVIITKPFKVKNKKRYKKIFLIYKLNLEQKS
jgi:hypothetical protein